MNSNKNKERETHKGGISPMNVAFIGLVSFAAFLVAAAVTFWVNPDLQQNLRKLMNPPQPTSTLSASVALPNITGLSLSEARETLIDAGFNVGRITEITSFLTPGIVLNQNPKAGETLAQGSLIDVEITVKGQTNMPYLIGIDLEEAENSLERSGFVEIKSRMVNSPMPAGIVLEQQPEAGVPMLQGTPITLTVSNGKVSVPNVTGLSEEEARSILTKEGFTVSVTYQNDLTKLGIVISQSPESIKSSEKVRTVDLIVGGEGVVEIPTPSSSATPMNSGDPNPAASTSPIESVSPEPTPSS